MRADLTERVLRGLYSAAIYLLVPVTVYHLIWRGFRHEAYFERWSERYAAYSQAREPVDIWVHAVSLGEVNAAAPLVNALLKQHPHRRLLITSITPTGSARIAELWGDQVQHVYLPYDLSGMVRRFLAHFQPKLGLVMETELWPNLLLGSRDAGVPVWIVNARLSERSLRGYRVLAPLVSRALRSLRGVLAQSDDDAQRFVRLGAAENQVRACGNLKFDQEHDPQAATLASQLRQRAGTRPVWIAASTHPEEEAHVIAWHRRLRKHWPDALLLWAPRHPERFRPVIEQAMQAGWQVATRKHTHFPGSDDAVFVIDTLGELAKFYACADVAFVGGSLQPIGGHNLLEPAAAGCAIVTGPHLHNTTDIAKRLREVQALRVGEDAQAIGDALHTLLAAPDTRAQAAAAGKALVEAGRGSLERVLAALEHEPALRIGPWAVR